MVLWLLCLKALRTSAVYSSVSFHVYPMSGSWRFCLTPILYHFFGVLRCFLFLQVLRTYPSFRFGFIEVVLVAVCSLRRYLGVIYGTGTGLIGFDSGLGMYPVHPRRWQGHIFGNCSQIYILKFEVGIIFIVVRTLVSFVR